MYLYRAQCFIFCFSLQHKTEVVRDIKETEDFNDDLPNNILGRDRRNTGILRALARTLSTIPRNDIRCVRICGSYAALLRRAAMRNRFSRRRNFVPFYLSCVGLCDGMSVKVPSLGFVPSPHPPAFQCFINQCKKAGIYRAWG